MAIVPPHTHPRHEHSQYADAVAVAALYGRNRIINGAFMINQRVYASASSLASGVYGFDRWKSGANGTTLTFTAAPQGQPVTISSAGVLAQVIERSSMRAGTYTLSWTGTATGRVYNSGGSAPSYATSPVNVTIDGTADVVVEFTASGGTKTLSDVQIEEGSVATPYEQKSYADTLLDCQRYYWRVDASSAGQAHMWMGVSVTTTTAYFPITFPVRMRAIPTLSSLGIGCSDGAVSNKTGGTFTLYGGGYLSDQHALCQYIHGSAAHTAHWPEILSINGVGSYFAFSAEL